MYVGYSQYELIRSRFKGVLSCSVTCCSLWHKTKASATIKTWKYERSETAWIPVAFAATSLTIDREMELRKIFPYPLLLFEAPHSRFTLRILRSHHQADL